jgi:hypothetical protein
MKAPLNTRDLRRPLGWLLMLAIVLLAISGTLAQAPDAEAQRGRDPSGSQRTVLGAVTSTGCFTDTSQTDFQIGTANNCDLTSSPGAIVLSSGAHIDQQNTSLGNSGVSITVTTWGGQTFTPSVTGTLDKVDINLFCSGCTGTTPNLTLSLRATSGGLPTGSDLASATISGFNSGSAAYYTATFASPPTLTAGTQYALVIRPTANPSPGTYALTRSGTSTVGADVYAGGTRVAGATSGTVWSVPLTGGVSTDAGFNIYINPGFSLAGDFTSSTKDASPAVGETPNWTTLSWNATTPTNTSLRFQVAASTNPVGPFTFVGPDGTGSTFYTTTGESLAQFSGMRYLQYKAYLGTTDNGVTPTLNDVTVCYENTVPDTATPTETSTSTATATETSTLTPTATSTSTPTATQSPTSTPTVALTVTPTGTASSTATSTSSPTPTLSAPIPTPTATATVVPISTATHTPAPINTATQTPLPAATPKDDDKEDSPREQTAEQRYQSQHTNAGHRSDVATEGNVLEVTTTPNGLSIVIADADGLVTIIYPCGSACPAIRPGNYVEVSGEKENEQLYQADDVTVTN